MSQDELIQAISAAFADHTQLRGLFLVGSFGKGTADAFSDIDFVAVVEEAGRAEFPAVWRAALGGISPVVFWNQRPIGGILINAITEDWTRCDLHIPADCDPSALGMIYER